jgi:hypothetical protein
MATQADVMNYIKNNYDYTNIAGGVLKLTFGSENGRSQLVFAYVGDAFLETYSPFATTDQITASQAFAANSSVFGLGLFENLYCLKQATLLESVDPEEIEVAFNTLAGVADGLEKNLGLGDNL